LQSSSSSAHENASRFARGSRSIRIKSGPSPSAISVACSMLACRARCNANRADPPCSSGVSVSPAPSFATIRVNSATIARLLTRESRQPIRVDDERDRRRQQRQHRHDAERERAPHAQRHASASNRSSPVRARGDSNDRYVNGMYPDDGPTGCDGLLGHVIAVMR
jgi:hypothetical protein